MIRIDPTVTNRLAAGERRGGGAGRAGRTVLEEGERQAPRPTVLRGRGLANDCFFAVV